VFDRMFRDRSAGGWWESRGLRSSFWCFCCWVYHWQFPLKTYRKLPTTSQTPNLLKVPP